MTIEPEIQRCSAYLECENEALRNFPSAQECDHEVCLSCLDKMIAECQTFDYLPMCPNEQCRLPYRFESVSALRELFPSHATFFAGLALDLNHGYETIRDDTITPIEIPIDYNAKEQQLELKCGISDDDEGAVSVVFSKSGTLGEFIREIRHTLEIMPTDKVYGYFLRHGEGDDKQLAITPENVNKPISHLHLEPESIVIVDMSGIVLTKSRSKTNSTQ